MSWTRRYTGGGPRWLREEGAAPYRGRCARCGRQDTVLVWAMWSGRLVQVGRDCAAVIAAENLARS